MVFNKLKQSIIRLSQRNKHSRKSVSAVDEIKEKENSKEIDTMENEVKKEAVEKEQTDTKATETETKATEEKPIEVEKVEENKDVEEKAVEEEPKVEEKPQEEQPTEEQPKVEEETTTALGIRIEDLATKDDLAQALSALNAKLDALVNENAQLKDKLAESESENKGLKQKYEEGDFGTNYKQGTPIKNEAANETFEEYSRKFMNGGKF